LGPEHLSAYALKIEPGTEFYREKLTVDGDLQADMYLALADKMKKAGYDHYEISNFAKPGFESQHNLRYWENAETVGIGISSASYVDYKRVKNSGHFSAYLERCLNGKLPDRTEEMLDVQERQKEDIMLKLRLGAGVELAKLKELELPLIDTFINKELARVEDGRFSLTPQGWLLSNQLFQQLVS
jgi:oxygen-independent coproporphyrinogen-3 oxidase